MMPEIKEYIEYFLAGVHDPIAELFIDRLEKKCKIHKISIGRNITECCEISKFFYNKERVLKYCKNGGPTNNIIRKNYFPYYAYCECKRADGGETQ